MSKVATQFITGFEPFTTGQGLILDHNPTAGIAAQVAEAEVQRHAHRAPALAREGRRPAAAAERPERRRRGPRDRADERQGDDHGDGVDDPQEDRRPGAAPLAPAQDGLEVVAVVAELAERPAVVLGAERVAARVAAGAALVALACVEINQ